MDRRLRGDACAAAPVGSGTQPAHRGPAPRRVPGRGERDARWALGRDDARRIRERAPCDAPHRRRAETPRLARAAATTAAAPAVRFDRYAQAGVITALCTLVAFAMYPHFELSNLVMIYLLGVTVAGLRLGRGPSALTAVL